MTEARITEQDKLLLKASFENNDDGIKLLRKIFFKQELSKEEQKQVDAVFGGKKELQALMRKLIVPKLEDTNPLSQNFDAYMFTYKNTDGKDLDEILMKIQVTEILQTKLEEGMLRIEGSNEKISGDDMSFLTEQSNIKVLKFLARNQYIGYIETVMSNIKTLSQIAGKSQSEIEEVIRMNSAK